MFGKRELIVTNSIEEEARVRYLLQSNGISSTSEYPNRSSSISPERYAAPRAGEVQTCVFYVKKKDYDRAVFALQEGKR